MLSLAHTVISLPFAFYLQNPFIIFAAAFLGHLISDTLLHWNIYPYTFKRYPYELVALDIASGVAMVWLLFPGAFFSFPIWLAIAGGNMPDILHGFWEMLAKNRQQRMPSWIQRWFRFHENLQIETTSMPRGLVWQIILIAIALAATRQFMG